MPRRPRRSTSANVEHLAIDFTKRTPPALANQKETYARILNDPVNSQVRIANAVRATGDGITSQFVPAALLLGAIGDAVVCAGAAASVATRRCRCPSAGRRLGDVPVGGCRRPGRSADGGVGRDRDARRSLVAADRDGAADSGLCSRVVQLLRAWLGALGTFLATWLFCSWPLARVPCRRRR